MAPEISTLMSPADPTPERLLSRARCGDVDALGHLLDLYRNYLRLLARSLIGRDMRGRLDQSDVVQETFLHAHQGFAEFRGNSEAELLAWLRTILARDLAHLLRLHRRQSRDVRREEGLETLLENADQSLQNALAAPGSSPSRHAAHREQAVLLADALTNLTADQRDVFLARHVDQVPVEDIARQMNRTPNAVRMLWLRAVQNLNAMLGER